MLTCYHFYNNYKNIFFHIKITDVSSAAVLFFIVFIKSTDYSFTSVLLLLERGLEIDY
jgi:hypothetical protein